MNVTVGIHEAKTRLSELVRLVNEGTEVTITNRGHAVARLARPRQPARRELGFDTGVLLIPEDFDAPLPDEVLDSFG